MAEKALTTGFDWSTPPGKPPARADSLDAIIKAVEDSQSSARSRSSKRRRTLSAGDTVKFFTGPKTLGDIPKIDFLWFLLCDQIHHRGQLSVYLRMADGKVPSIYGPERRRALVLDSRMLNAGTRRHRERFFESKNPAPLRLCAEI